MDKSLYNEARRLQVRTGSVRLMSAVHGRVRVIQQSGISDGVVRAGDAGGTFSSNSLVQKRL